jgi:hypothetical protein
VAVQHHSTLSRRLRARINHFYWFLVANKSKRAQGGN